MNSPCCTKENGFLDLMLASYSVKQVIQYEVQCYISLYHELDYGVFQVEKSLITQITFKH